MSLSRATTSFAIVWNTFKNKPQINHPYDLPFIGDSQMQILLPLYDQEDGDSFQHAKIDQQVGSISQS